MEVVSLFVCGAARRGLKNEDDALALNISLIVPVGAEPCACIREQHVAVPNESAAMKFRQAKARSYVRT